MVAQRHHHSAIVRVVVGDTVRSVMQDNKIVVETELEELIEDSIVMAFLDTVEVSIHTASEFSLELMEAMKALTADIEVDLDDPIDGDVIIFTVLGLDKRLAKFLAAKQFFDEI